MEDEQKKSFIQKVPGFRSGKWWKKFVASIGYLLILLIIIGSLLPGPSVEDEVKNARKYISENKYSLAVYSYEQALKKWETGKNYSVNKEEIEKELEEARIPYAKQLIAEAKQKLDSGEIARAEELLKMAQSESPSLEEIKVISEQITKAQTLQKANRLLDESQAAFNKGNSEESISKFKEAVLLSSDNPRNAELKEKLAPTMKNKTEEYIEASKKALNEWNLIEAESKITFASIFDAENVELASLKERLADMKSTINEIGPRPINSAWDASITIVKDFLKYNLKDPDSVQYDEWSNVVLSNWNGKKCWAVRCRYRAKNSFGGYVLSNKIFYVKNNQVIGYKDF